MDSSMQSISEEKKIETGHIAETSSKNSNYYYSTGKSYSSDISNTKDNLLKKERNQYPLMSPIFSPDLRTEV